VYTVNKRGHPLQGGGEYQDMTKVAIMAVKKSAIRTFGR